jgi:hypothetical protein
LGGYTWNVDSSPVVNKIMNISPKNIYISQHRTLVFFAILIAALYTFSVVMQIAIGFSDFPAHIKIAEEGQQLPPYFLYQLLLIAIHGLFGISFIHAAFIAVFFIVFTTFIVAYKSIADNNLALNRRFLVLATSFLLLSHPVAILFPYDQHLYLGYIAANVYHNPTILLLKMVALLHFVLLVNLLPHKENARYSYTNIFLLGLLTALTIIAKPNYIIALLPALFMLLLIQRVFTSGMTDWFLIVGLGVVIPAFILLLWQYLFFYGSGSANSIRVGFFEIFTLSSPLWMLVPKLIASMAFPISVLIAMGSRLTQQLDFQLSALMFAVSLIYTYLLVDTVAGTIAGNFGWSAQISHFLLLFVCIKAYLNFVFGDKEQRLQWTKKRSLPIYIGVLQFIFGIVWYVANTAPKFGAIPGLGVSKLW